MTLFSKIFYFLNTVNIWKALRNVDSSLSTHSITDIKLSAWAWDIDTVQTLLKFVQRNTQVRCCTSYDCFLCN